MAFESKKVYRAINGSEIKTIISQRVLAAMMEDNALNMARSFPLLRYEVSVKLTPYHAAGPTEVKPDPDITYSVDGAVFCPVLDQAVELVEKSPLYGRESDPQDLRVLAEQGTVETTRTTTGELVDVRTKPGSRTEPAVEPPPVQIEAPQSWEHGWRDPCEREHGKAPGIQVAGPGKITGMSEPAVISEKPEETLAIETQRWAQRKPDEAVDKATESRDPTLAPGRVSTITPGGGQNHGKWRK